MGAGTENTGRLSVQILQHIGFGNLQEFLKLKHKITKSFKCALLKVGNLQRTPMAPSTEKIKNRMKGDFRWCNTNNRCIMGLFQLIKRLGLGIEMVVAPRRIGMYTGNRNLLQMLTQRVENKQKSYILLQKSKRQKLAQMCKCLTYKYEPHAMGLAI